MVEREDIDVSTREAQSKRLSKRVLKSFAEEQRVEVPFHIGR